MDYSLYLFKSDEKTQIDLNYFRPKSDKCQLMSSLESGMTSPESSDRSESLL